MGIGDDGLSGLFVINYVVMVNGRGWDYVMI